MFWKTRFLSIFKSIFISQIFFLAVACNKNTFAAANPLMSGIKKVSDSDEIASSETLESISEAMKTKSIDLRVSEGVDLFFDLLHSSEGENMWNTLIESPLNPLLKNAFDQLENDPIVVLGYSFEATADIYNSYKQPIFEFFSDVETVGDLLSSYNITSRFDLDSHDYKLGVAKAYAFFSEVIKSGKSSEFLSANEIGRKELFLQAENTQMENSDKSWKPQDPGGCAATAAGTASCVVGVPELAPLCAIGGAIAAGIKCQ